MNARPDGTRRDATLHDVAREAGVAVSTASRALSNPGRVSERTRVHVQAVAERLRYRPNRIAQALPSGRTRMLGLLVADITNLVHLRFIRGAENRAANAGYTLVLADGQEDPDVENLHADRLGSAVDGFVLVSPRMGDDELRELAQRRPVVLFNRTLEGVPGLVLDIDDACRQTIAHLAGLGHRRVVYVAGPPAAWTDAQRHHGLARHAEVHGVELVEVGPFLPTVGFGAEAADAALATGATAVVAFNDMLAIGILRRFEQAGVPVPGAVSVVGFDDIFGADFCRPPLTTVTSPAELAGSMLVDMLTGQVDAHELVLPAPLVVRSSTGSPIGP